MAWRFKVCKYLSFALFVSVCHSCPKYKPANMASTLRTSFQDQDHGNHQAEKLQRRQSKRQFFRNLLPKRESTINQLETVQDQDQSLGSNSEAAKLQRRQSKRVILRNLLLPKRNSIDTNSRRKSGQNLVSYFPNIMSYYIT